MCFHHTLGGAVDQERFKMADRAWGGVGDGVVVQSSERGIFNEQLELRRQVHIPKSPWVATPPHCTLVAPREGCSPFLSTYPSCYKLSSLTLFPSKADLEDLHQVSMIGRKVLILKYLKQFPL